MFCKVVGFEEKGEDRQGQACLFFFFKLGNRYVLFFLVRSWLIQRDFEGVISFGVLILGLDFFGWVRRGGTVLVRVLKNEK